MYVFNYQICLHCNDEKLGHLAKHFEIVGGDKTIISASDTVSKAISGIVKSIRNVLESDGRCEVPVAVCPYTNIIVLDRFLPMQTLYDDSFNQYSYGLSEFRKSLYHQKHAFYFRAVSKWEEYLKVTIIDLFRGVDVNQSSVGSISESIW